MKRTKIGILAGAVILGIILSLVFSPKSRKDTEETPGHSLKEANEALNRGDFKGAKALYEEAMELSEDANELKKIQEKIENVNMKIIFSSIIDECSREYVVRPKDVLVKIARKFSTTVELIKRANDLSSDMIRPGQKLKVNDRKFSVVIDKSRNLLFLKREGEVIKTYIVSTGKDDSTPIGDFKIVNKLVKPTWFKTGAVIPPDSPENILGSRWMGFDLKGYGIHGTTDPGNLGKQITLGCVRMENKDVEELFDIIPTGAEVTIVD